MGTDLEMNLVAEDETAVNAAFDKVVAEMNRIENVMSEWREGTKVSEINRNAGIKPVEVTEELFNLISASIQVSELTEGAFDISWASMRGVWSFAKGSERLPTAEEIKERLPLVNYKNIELDNEKKTVYLKTKGMAIGLGAIAKGYAVDKAAQILFNSGVRNFVIKAGGDMRVQGAQENGKPWPIGIRHPRDREKFIAKLHLTNISISTSGDYERFFIRDGVLYHHIMDPKTGYPARGSQSVTIIAHDTMTSDAFSTAIFVLGPEKGLKLISKLKGIEAVIVDDTGKISGSSGVDIRTK
ncbi:MAG: FAD:protein FMN transferase [Deltaproteobacteria bacterium]|nr:FAD:protein FMN transferase [Deltaproteobacteria bacterium]